LIHFDRYFFFGDPYTGHFREFTLGELKKMLRWSGFDFRKVYGKNSFVVPKTRGVRGTSAWRWFEKAYEAIPTLCEHLVVVATKGEPPSKER
jgi:hypothetical protein